MPGAFVNSFNKTLRRGDSAERAHSQNSGSLNPPVAPMRRMPQRKKLAGGPKLELPIVPIGLVGRPNDGATGAANHHLEKTNEFLMKPQSSYGRMSMVLNDSTFSKKIDSIDSIEDGDVLVRMSKINYASQVVNQSNHDDLVVHAAILFVDKKSSSEFSFKRVEMKEASSYCNMIGFSDKYHMGLNLDEANGSKPDLFLNHGVTYKVQTPWNKNASKERFDRAISDEIGFIRNNPYVYGSGVDGHYNCNTFVANVLLRACDVAGSVAQNEGSSGSATNAAGPDSA